MTTLSRFHVWECTNTCFYKERSFNLSIIQRFQPKLRRLNATEKIFTEILQIQLNSPEKHTTWVHWKTSLANTSIAKQGNSKQG